MYRDEGLTRDRDRGVQEERTSHGGAVETELIDRCAIGDQYRSRLTRDPCERIMASWHPGTRSNRAVVTLRRSRGDRSASVVLRGLRTCIDAEVGGMPPVADARRGAPIVGLASHFHKT